MISQPQLTCPRCGKDDRVQKVSVVFAQSSGTGIAYSHVSESYVPQGFTSTLAVRLAQPTKPTDLGMWFVLLGWLFLDGTFCLLPSFFFCGSTVISSSFSSNLDALTKMVFFSLGLGGIVIYAGVTVSIWIYIKHNDAKAEAAQQKAYAKWDKLYYCMRDDTAFVPNTTIVMPSQAVQNYIWS